jgi:hypothetical protein
MSINSINDCTENQLESEDSCCGGTTPNLLTVENRDKCEKHASYLHSISAPRSEESDETETISDAATTESELTLSQLRIGNLADQSKPSNFFDLYNTAAIVDWADDEDETWYLQSGSDATRPVPGSGSQSKGECGHTAKSGAADLRIERCIQPRKRDNGRKGNHSPVTATDRHSNFKTLAPSNVTQQQAGVRSPLRQHQPNYDRNNRSCPSTPNVESRVHETNGFRNDRNCGRVSPSWHSEGRKNCGFGGSQHQLEQRKVVVSSSTTDAVQNPRKQDFTPQSAELCQEFGDLGGAPISAPSSAQRDLKHSLSCSEMDDPSLRRSGFTAQDWRSQASSVSKAPDWRNGDHPPSPAAFVEHEGRSRASSDAFACRRARHNY